VGLRVRDTAFLDEVEPMSDGWRDAAEAVDAWIEGRHGDEPVWQRVRRQEQELSTLLDGGWIRGRLIVTERPDV
jgi:hypothetical protein